MTSEESAELRKLRAEVRELRRADEILNAPRLSSHYGARPPAASLVRFISEHKSRFGVEPVCRVLTEHGCKIAPSTYYDAVRRGPSAAATRDEQLKAGIRRVHAGNYGVYGARKVWLQLNREGTAVARCTVERLMRELGLQGARRGKRSAPPCPARLRRGRRANVPVA